jgi:hypothetical protein
MVGIVKALLGALLASFKPWTGLVLENLALRHQLIVLRRTRPRRIRLCAVDRLLFVWLYRLWPGVLEAMAIVRPETVLRWHRDGFRAYWRWKSRSRPGRPRVPREVRDLIRQMSLANRLWGAPRIHGELLKLGVEVAQSTVAKYMVKHRRPPSQSWAIFLRNHADGIAAIDLLVVPTIDFRLLYCLIILGHGRRRLVHYAVTADPTDEWIARQIVEAFPWEEAPTFLVRDHDAAWRDREAASAWVGHPRSTHHAPVAVAERTGGAADRLDPARMPRSSLSFRSGLSTSQSS